MRLRSTKYALWVVGIIAAILIVWYLWLSKGTPPSQPSLTSLTQNNLAQFTGQFDGAAGDERLLVLVSPT